MAHSTEGWGEFDNALGQSGDPESPVWDRLVDRCARDRLFPAARSRDKIESVVFEQVESRPKRQLRQSTKEVAA